MANWTIIKDGSITSPQGFTAGAVGADVKGNGKSKLDIAMIYSEKEAVATGLFTLNKFAAPPTHYCREALKDGKARAIVVNSGNANAATGKKGLEDARKMAEIAAKKLGLETEEVLVCSTGTIGVHLPMDRISAGIEKIELSSDNGHLAEQAIMTTDTVPKEIAMELELSGGKVVIGSMAKGAGMIHPNLATMLGFVTTDADISSEALKKMFKDSVDKSYNMMTVDGDTSTNDTLIAIANGASGVVVKSDEDLAKFAEAIEYICVEMAKKISADGEGASHSLVVNAKNLQTLEDARKVAKAVAGSMLFKCAIFGQDANWGRVISAAGYSGAEFRTDLIDVSLESQAGLIEVMKDGAALKFDEKKAADILKEKEIIVNLDFHDGDVCATAYGCDLTYDYVKINGDYRT